MNGRSENVRFLRMGGSGEGGSEYSGWGMMNLNVVKLD